MKVFICWSGIRGQNAALILEQYLPLMIQDVEPFMSSESIRKGAKWAGAIAAGLAESEVGIVCLTPESLTNEWIHFESGGLSNSLASEKVMTLLIGIGAGSEVQGPLAQFQNTKLEEADFFRLLVAINKANQKQLKDDVLKASFEAHWPKVLSALTDIANSTPEGSPTTARNESSILEELLALAQEQSDRLNKSSEIREIILRGSRSLRLGASLQNYSTTLPESAPREHDL